MEIDMYYYIQEFCTPYLQLLSVEYEKKEDEQWHKADMACDDVTVCKVPLEKCKHFKNVPETVSADQLRENKLWQQR